MADNSEVRFITNYSNAKELLQQENKDIPGSYVTTGILCFINSILVIRNRDVARNLWKWFRFATEDTFAARGGCGSKEGVPPPCRFFFEQN